MFQLSSFFQANSTATCTVFEFLREEGQYNIIPTEYGMCYALISSEECFMAYSSHFVEAPLLAKWLNQVNERMPGRAPKCSLPARTMSAHVHAYRHYSCQSAKAQFMCHRLLFFFIPCSHQFFFSNFLHPIGVWQVGVEPGLKAPPWQANSPQAPPRRITPGRWANICIYIANSACE